MAARLNFAKTTILAVDDSALSLDILSQILLGFGINETTKHETVAGAQEALTNGKFDLVILDDKMPGMSGLDLVAWIRGDTTAPNYTVPIIVASGDPTKARIVNARDAGANYVIAKPMVPGVLLGRMQGLARTNREFITSDNYRGPDRRIRALPIPAGMRERRADAIRMMQTPDRALSQDEISSLFG